jgi:hypothetical protein
MIMTEERIGMNSAGLIYDDSRHYIDHLAPFCALKGWPLIVCEEAVGDLARKYYPGLEVLEASCLDLALPKTIVSCDTRPLIEAALGRKIDSDLLWLPHGNSDKGWDHSSFSALEGHTALVYGNKMIDVITKQKVATRTIKVGNFRLEYWKRNQAFYEKILRSEIDLPPKNKTYLYAPTWYDQEGNGTFWEAFPLLAKHLPADCNLIVKIHPNTYARHTAAIEALIGRYKTILFLSDFPPIYPLLSLSDAYIGDMSSIGYDYLYWNRPMFFLNSKRLDPNTSPSLFLFRCGFDISLEQIPKIYSLQDGPFTEIRSQVYEYTFNQTL